GPRDWSSDVCSSDLASPEDTWRAIHELEVVRRSGTQLSAALPLYVAQTDPGTPVDRREMLVAIETLNQGARVLVGVPFDTALARDRKSVVEGKRVAG